MYFNEKTAARLINKMFRGVKDTTRECCKNAFFDKLGRQCALDGFRAYRLKKPVAGVPDMDAEKGIDMERIFPKAEALADYITLELPSLADVKAMLAEDNAAKRRKEEASFVFTFGTDPDSGAQLPAVNIQYLADMLEMFPDAIARCSTKSPFNPLYFTSEDGDGLLLPVRPKDMEKAKKRRQPATKKDDPCKGLPVYGLRAFLALAAANA